MWTKRNDFSQGMDNMLESFLPLTTTYQCAVDNLCTVESAEHSTMTAALQNASARAPDDFSMEAILGVTMSLAACRHSSQGVLKLEDKLVEELLQTLAGRKRIIHHRVGLRFPSVHNRAFTSKAERQTF
eukprot:4162070-Amphidinium_carterae.1